MPDGAERTSIALRVENPSTGAVLYQCLKLRAQLKEFQTEHYPREAVLIARIFDTIASRGETLLTAIHKRPPLNRSDKHDLRVLAEVVQTIHSHVRYLSSTDHISTPPGIQTAISNLIERFFCPALNCNTDDVVALVRPQWHYNLKFVGLIETLKRAEAIIDIDHGKGPNYADLDELLCDLWVAYPNAKHSPKHIAVLSFAGLDRDDVLLYPLLAHEIGHFIDASYQETIHQNPKVTPPSWWPSLDEVIEAIERVEPSPELLRPVAAQFHQQLWKSLVDRLLSCMRELTADLLATRMLGVAYFFALAEFMKPQVTWPQKVIEEEEGYPGIAFRIQNVIEELCGPSPAMSMLEQLAYLRREQPGGAIDLGLKHLEAWNRRVKDHVWPETGSSGAKRVLEDLAEKKLQEALPRLRELVRIVIPDSRTYRVPSSIDHLVSLLSKRIPPFQVPITATGVRDAAEHASFSDVLFAGWFYQVAYGDDYEESVDDVHEQHGRYRDTCTLLFKAIELSGSDEVITRIRAKNSNDTRELVSLSDSRSIGVLSGPAVLARLIDTDDERRLSLCPFLGISVVSGSSVDIHLGNWFRIATRTQTPSLNLANPADWARARDCQEEEFVGFGKAFVLHPGDFALGVSLEYVQMPSDIMAYVEGKSSLGRAGIIIATASTIAPGFGGCIVLELCNAGTVPLILAPGMPIAQLVFQELSEVLPPDWRYRGRFRCQVKP